MKFIMGQFTKDSMRLKGWLALWTMTLLGYLFLCWLVTRHDALGTPHPPGMEAMLFIMGSFKKVLIMMLTFILIYEEFPGGTTAFWLTRPISVFALLIAKAAFCILFIVLPFSLFAGVALTIQGLHYVDLPWALLRSFVFSCEMISFAAVGAVLAPNFYIFLTILFVMLSLLFIEESAFAHVFGFAFQTITDTETIELFFAKFVAIMVLGLGIVTHQYFFRRTARSFFFAGAAIFILVILEGSYLSRAESFSLKNDTLPDLKTECILICVAPHRVTEMKDGTKDVCALFTVGNVPEGYHVLPYYYQSRLTFPSGFVITNEPLPVAGYISRDGSKAMDQQRIALQQALGPVTLINQPETLGHSPMLLVSPLDYETYLNTTGTYTADIAFKVYRYELIDTVDLGEMSACEGGADRISFTGIYKPRTKQQARRLYAANKKLHRPLSRKDRNAHSHRLHDFLPDINYFLYDQTDELVLAPISNSWKSSRVTAEFDLKQPSFQLTPGIKNNFMSNSTLLVVQRMDVGEFFQTYERTNFCLRTILQDDNHCFCPCSKHKEK